MATLLNYLNNFARFVGENDYTSLETVATSLINDAIKNISSSYHYSCNKRKDSLTTSSGSVDLPTDIDYSHLGKIKVYSYTGTTEYEYKRVDMKDLDQYTGATDYVYAIDFENKHLLTPTDVTVSLDYYCIPGDLDENTDIFDFPVPEAISRQAAGQYWQSFEEDPDQAKLNLTLAENLISRAVLQEKKSVPYMTFRPYGGRSTGFNNTNGRGQFGYKR